MAPHDTNTPEKVRTRRHVPTLIGLAVIFTVVLIAFFWWGSDAGDPVGPETTPGAAQSIEPVE